MIKIEELNKLSKRELVERYKIYIGTCNHQRNVIIYKTAQIRHFRIRIKKIRNSIDYILGHPFSFDTSNKKRKT